MLAPFPAVCRALPGAEIEICQVQAGVVSVQLTCVL